MVRAEGMDVGRRVVVAAKNGMVKAEYEGVKEEREETRKVKVEPDW